MIIFLHPDGNGRGRYQRQPWRDPVLTGVEIVKAERKSGAATHAALKLVRCPIQATADSPRIVREVEIVEQFESFPIDALEWTLDSTKYPDGQYALTTDAWCMTLPIVIDNGGYRNDIPQYAALAPMAGIGGRGDSDSGWCWVKWTGKREIRQVKRPIKHATPIQGRPKPEDLVAQRLTYMAGVSHAPWEWRIGATGAIHTHYKNQYHRSGLDGLGTGLNRDGYINEGRISHPGGGFVHPDGSLIVASRAGRVVRIHLDGYVETIAGSYIPSHLPHPVRTSGRFAEFYETVGIDLAGGCHDVCGDPGDPDIIYIADTNNHRILKGRLSTKQFETLIGGRGYENGVSEPRGLDIGPDGTLAIADYRNLSIAFCNKDTGEILWRFDSIRPSGEHRAEDWDGTTKIPEHFHAKTERIRFLANWGVAGEAAFLYPSMCRFDSNGDLIIAHDRQQQLSRLRLSGTPTIEHVAGIEPDTSPDTYAVISVDKVGAFGEVDDMFVCNWEHASEIWFDKDGNRVGRMQNRAGRRGVLWDGYYPNSQNTLYPQTVIAGQDGSLWTGGVAGCGIHRYIARTDEPIPDINRLQSGVWLWEKHHHPERPMLYLLAGIAGQDQWGGLMVDELAQRTDAEIAAYIRGTLTRDDLTDAEMAGVIYYLRSEAITDAVSVSGAVEIPDEPEEPEPEEPDMPEEPIETVKPEVVSIVEEAKGKWQKTFFGVEVTEPDSLILMCVAVRQRPDVIQIGSAPGIEDVPHYIQGAISTPLEFVVRDHSTGPDGSPGGKQARGVQLYMLRNPPVGVGDITYEWGRIGEFNTATSGSSGAAALVLKGVDLDNPYRDIQTHCDGPEVREIGIEIATDPNDLLICFCGSGGGNAITKQPIPDRPILFQDADAGDAASGTYCTGVAGGDGVFHWQVQDDDVAQSLALCAFSLRGIGAVETPEEPPAEEPHPSIAKIEQAQALLDEAKALL